ncbi:MAG: hypothetical protein KIT20_08975, partial [Alphaproteobacteria bacterium]|nr:hypothetical protein [Alphaproteobacteria bacterium]
RLIRMSLPSTDQRTGREARAPGETAAHRTQPAGRPAAPARPKTSARPERPRQPAPAAGPRGRSPQGVAEQGLAGVAFLQTAPQNRKPKAKRGGGRPHGGERNRHRGGTSGQPRQVAASR